MHSVNCLYIRYFFPCITATGSHKVVCERTKYNLLAKEETTLFHQPIQNDLQQIRTMADQLAQLEQTNAQKLHHISQLCNQVSQEVNRVFQTVQQQAQTIPTGIQQQPFQPQQTIGTQPSGTHEWVQRHMQPGTNPAFAQSVLHQGVSQQTAPYQPQRQQLQ